jgi:predicted alpha/beta-fold hydrolase
MLPQHNAGYIFLFYFSSSLTFPSCIVAVFHWVLITTIMMDFSWMLGRARMSWYHHPSPVEFTQEGSSKTISLLEVAKQATPPCHLNPLLFNGHLQTFWTAVKGTDIPIFYKRHVFSAEDVNYRGTFAVDFVVPPYTGSDDSLPSRTTNYTDEEFAALGSDDTKPMLIVLHGLSGGSHEIYLRAAIEPLVKARWEVCVVNARGCAQSKITSSVLYNARATWDVRQTVKWAREKWPKRKLYGMGFSLGANIMTNYLGEEGDKCLLTAAVIASNPWNLDASSLALQRSWIGMKVYSPHMGASMKKLFEEHVEQVSKNPRIDLEAVRKTRYLHEFDRELQGPTWGYPTEGAYYRDASSCDSLLAVRIPLLAIHAEDDPIASQEAVPLEEFKKTPWAVLLSTSLGGHLSWFESGGGRWFAKPGAQFLQRVHNDLDLVSTETKQEMGNGLVGVDVPQVSPFIPMRRRLFMPSEVESLRT